MNNIEKLPKWAQHEIRILEMRLHEAQTALASAWQPVQDGYIGASINVPNPESPHSHQGKEIMLPNHRVTFHLADDNEVDIMVEPDCLSRNELRISVCGIGDLAIRPRASNSFNVELT